MAAEQLTAVEAKAEYDRLAAETTAYAKQIPSIEAAIREEVTRQMGGEPKKKLGELKERKRLAWQAWQEAEAREVPVRMQSQAEAIQEKVVEETQKIAASNKKRRQDLDEAHNKRLKESVRVNKAVA